MSTKITKKKSNIVPIVVGIIILLVVLGAGFYWWRSRGATVTAVEVTPPTATLAPNNVQLFKAVVKNESANATNQTVTWAIRSGPGSIDQTGLYTAAGTGTTTITATSNADTTKVGTANITITANGGNPPSPPPPSGNNRPPPSGNNQPPPSGNNCPPNIYGYRPCTTFKADQNYMYIATKGHRSWTNNDRDIAITIINNGTGMDASGLNNEELQNILLMKCWEMRADPEFSALIPVTNANRERVIQFITKYVKINLAFMRLVTNDLLQSWLLGR